MSLAADGSLRLKLKAAKSTSLPRHLSKMKAAKRQTVAGHYVLNGGRDF
jgi:hypothetical protein